MYKYKKTIHNVVLSAMFIALGIVLPFFTGQIPQIGNMLLPMHIPVLLCGLICGWQYGAVVGFTVPMLRFALFTVPVFTSAIAMAFELMTYGLITGIIYGRCKWKCVISLYRTLLIAMLSGRVVWGAAMLVISGASGNVFTWNIYIAGAFLNSIPGITLQLIIIPAVMLAFGKTGLVHFYRKKPERVKEKY